MSSQGDKPHVPPPSLWPIGFAVGIACILIGLVVSWPVAAVGAVIAIAFGFLWIRDVTGAVREPAPPIEPETRRLDAEGEAPRALEGREAMPQMSEEEIAAYPRSTFLSAATLGLGGVIGGIITLPVLGFAVLPSFTNQDDQNVELGPLENFTEGQFVIATYLEDFEVGEVTRRTVFVRNNGMLEARPSFTILFSRCVHLGCPVQPNGLVYDEQKKTVGKQRVDLTPTFVTGFGCPCHGGQYDTEGNRTAGPPVRALDRYEFKIRNGRLLLSSTYSVAAVKEEGAQARFQRYRLADPGTHVDGLEAWLYPVQAPS